MALPIVPPEQLTVADKTKPTQSSQRSAAPKLDWPNDLPSKERLTKIALATAPLVLFYRRWVHRRVEEIEFIDESRIRRHLSIDFTLPDLSALLPGYADEPK